MLLSSWTPMWTGMLEIVSDTFYAMNVIRKQMTQVCLMHWNNWWILVAWLQCHHHDLDDHLAVMCRHHFMCKELPHFVIYHMCCLVSRLYRCIRIWYELWDDHWMYQSSLTIICRMSTTLFPVATFQPLFTCHQALCVMLPLWTRSCWWWHWGLGSLTDTDRVILT